MKIEKIHHVAYRCHDAKETVEWYMKCLNMDFVLAISEKRSTFNQGTGFPICIYFWMQATVMFWRFFELPTQPKMDRDRNTPEWVQHICVSKFVISRPLMQYKSHLEEIGVEVVGVTNHGIFDSIYFF